MIRIDEKVWIGNSDDGCLKLDSSGGTHDKISAVLNVAQDLKGRVYWPTVEYAQVGLIDGPGNEVVAYSAAIATLVTLTRRHDGVLVYDHSGGRALAVVIMYLSLIEGKVAERIDFLRRRSWDELMVVVGARSNKKLPRPHPAHREAFYKIPFSALEIIL